MKQWLEFGEKQVTALLKCDPDHKKLLEQMDIVQEAYIKIVERLSGEERDVVERYITICEDLEHQRTIAAWYCGKFNG